MARGLGANVLLLGLGGVGAAFGSIFGVAACGGGSHPIAKPTASGTSCTGVMCSVPQINLKEHTPGPQCGCTYAPSPDICPSSGPKIDCAGLDPMKAKPIEACGVEMNVETQGQTPVEIARTTIDDMVEEYAAPSGMTTPDLGCFTNASSASPGTSMMVTLYGWARNFASGCDATGTTIEVYRVMRTGDPSTDGTPGAMIGSTTLTDTSSCDSAPKCAYGTPPAMGQTCCQIEVQGKCDQMNGQNPYRAWRPYSIPNVPTETELLVKTSGDGKSSLYEYNVYIPNSEVQNGRYAHDVRSVDANDYTLIPTTAFGGMIHAGNGVVAGEVHDCGDIRIHGASVETNVGHPIAVGYFTDNESYPLPDTSALSTSNLGLYAIYDLPAGALRVSAVGVLGGNLVPLGYYDARIFPDSITSVSFHGIRPFQAAQIEKPCGAAGAGGASQ